VPKTPVEIDIFGEAVMLPRPEFHRLVRQGVIDPYQTEIARHTPKRVALRNGASFDADVVILATGWETDYGFLSESVRTRMGFGEDGYYLYRHMVHPDVPGLFFVGSASTLESMLTYNLQAR
jgi:hypothetical protein